ncbi:zinc metalloprotease [Methanosarcinales archaeon ex4572_44]|nr:MAG: zinc metalloprotease [Methanosarcinales archaeon ex4484_138]PHP45488.1 MAG: zinc metalloprotease [Methanosarcinales archaeon ex4572_44]RLG25175.1 MAG: site-2 protease family protein [Methanosarcinales archaeon]RLG28739.1 MAG: site-2 protease family protein [Methanosarcinales archaeon]HHI30464.1 site-2 protease family protein [Candidatus Methanoperedenaceae archaeon]
MNGQRVSEDQDLTRTLNFLEPYFKVYEYTKGIDTFTLYGIPRRDEELIRTSLHNLFTSHGIRAELKHDLGEHTIVVRRGASEEKGENISLNILLGIATVFTTMVMGAIMFGVNPLSDPHLIYRGLPFTIAIMTVLGSHEMAHYIAAKRHGMRTSLPYFIPIPLPPIGTMGAVIKHRGPIHSRKALFDVGISGPLVGLLVSMIVAAIGLTLSPVEIPHVQGRALELELPPLFKLIANSIGYTGETLHPVAFAGWVGMLVTALNLIPAGQLDGGHVLRAMLGKKANYISALTPIALITLGFGVNYILNQTGTIWLFWGLFISLFAAAGHPPPLNDTQPISTLRKLLGITTFILAALCITLTPFKI